MKFTYHIEQVTTLEPKVVNEKLVTELQELKYSITSVRETEIIFTERSGLKWRHEPSQLDEGIFNLDTKANVTLVKLAYTISYWSFLVSILFFLGLSIFEDPGALYLVGFILIVGVIEHFNLKFKAKALISVCKLA